MKGFWLALATVLGLAVQAVPASAAFTWTYTLNCNTSNCNSGNDYGTVKLTQIGSGTVQSPYQIQVTVNLHAGYTFDNSNATRSYALLWNLQNDPDTTISSVTNHFTVQDGGDNNHSYAALNPSTPIATPFTSSSCGTAANCFEYAIKDTRTDRTDSNLVFDVTKNGGLTMSSILNPFTKDNAGYYFAAYITNSSGADMWVGTNADPVPEPMTWTMSVAGLMGLAGFAMLQNRRKLAKAA